MPTLDRLRRELTALTNPKDAVFLQGFFKTGPGQYGEGDLFRGIRLPVLRTLAKAYERLDIRDVLELLQSPYHEDRLVALLILIRIYRRSDDAARASIYRHYLDHTRFINNWDLVDASAGYIVGDWLLERRRGDLTRLARSADLWERRIAIVATSRFIKEGEFEETLRIARLLLRDRHDLIHKAAGWMLREVGKRDLPALEAFLADHYKEMPRTMLRYAIERFPEPRRQAYLKGNV